MFCTDLSDSHLWGASLKDTVSRHSLSWLSSRAVKSPLGDFRLGESGRYVNVHEHETKYEEVCVWESHEATIDIQYVIRGVELIRWAPTGQLIGPVRRCLSQDRLEWCGRGPDESMLVMSSGRFAVFMPTKALAQ